MICKIRKKSYNRKKERKSGLILEKNSEWKKLFPAILGQRTVGIHQFLLRWSERKNEWLFWGRNLFQILRIEKIGERDIIEMCKVHDHIQGRRTFAALIVGIGCPADIQFLTDKGLRVMISFTKITQSFKQDLIVHESLPVTVVYLWKNRAKNRG